MDFFYIDLLCVFAHTCMFMHACAFLCVEVREQLRKWVLSFHSLGPGTNLVHDAWQKVPSPAEPACHAEVNF